MKCSSPYVVRQTINGSEFTDEVACGQCQGCRINRREEWACRILLESCFHDRSVFATLTYEDEKLPTNFFPPLAKPVPTLSKEHLRNFFKLFRYHVKRKIRYFAVGEYGDLTQRPHYHAVLFGSDAIHLPNQVNEEGKCLERSWPHGNVQCTPLTVSRARYVAQYTVKKRTRPGTFPAGVAPEFSVMSRRPGVAVRSVEMMAEVYRRYGITLSSAASSSREASTPGGYVRIDGKLWRVDAFLRGKLCEALGEQTPAISRALQRSATRFLDSLTPLEDHLAEHALSMTRATEERKRMKRGQAL